MILNEVPDKEEFDCATEEELTESLNQFKILLKNPSCKSLENNYTEAQIKRNLNFDSFKETNDHLNKNKNLEVVNFCYFVDAEVKDCIHCNGTGESVATRLFTQEVSGKINFFYVEGENIKKDNYSIMDGNIVEIKNSDFEFLLNEKETRGTKTIQEYVSKLNSTNFRFLYSQEIFLISINRSNEVGEHVLCKHCKGRKSYILNEKPSKFVHLWVIDKDNGCCFSINSALLNDEEVDNSVLLLNEASNNLCKNFTDLKDNSKTYKLKKWNGVVNSDTGFFVSFETFADFISEWKEPNELNEFINYSILEDTLFLWVIHPNKGYSIQIKIEYDFNNFEEENELINHFVSAIIKRNKLVFSNINK